MRKLPVFIILAMVAVVGIAVFMLTPLEDDAEIRALDEERHNIKTEAAFNGWDDLYNNIKCGETCSVCHPFTYTATLRWRRMFN